METPLLQARSFAMAVRMMAAVGELPKDAHDALDAIGDIIFERSIYARTGPVFGNLPANLQSQQCETTARWLTAGGFSLRERDRPQSNQERQNFAH
jgi:hypothetical protein